MAQRRMFSLQVVDTDVFLEMPTTTQNLYFHLCMRADDDGFISNPKKIMKITGCGGDDLKILLAKRFAIGFDSGILVIKHWRLHNYIRKDRYTETTYLEEKSTLEIKENGSYTEKENMTTICQPNDNQMDTQVRLGKVRIGKDSIEPKKPKFQKPTIQEINEYTLEINKTIDPESFYDHYESNGWKIGGKSAMKDWKASVRNWIRNDDKFKKDKPQSFRTQNQAVDDINEMSEEEANLVLKINQKQIGC